ncbi:MAG: molybdopterin oxidoreductase [Clostridia bacterium]|nr:MAG: molybdopterin oxidoreductase [Clostridia bacterium]
MNKNKGWTFAYWAVVIVMLVVGAVGLYWRLAYGHLMANYGELIVWGLWVAMYIYFIGLSAGSFLISALVYAFGVERFRPIARLALFTALIALLMALLHIWFDLGHMGRFYEVYTRPHFLSMMTWMVWLYTAYFILLLVEFWFETRQDLIRWGKKSGFTGFLSRILSLGSKDTTTDSRKRDVKVVKVLGIIGVPLAIMFHGGVGALFGVVSARPAWHSGLFPVLFLVSALVSGGGLLLAIYAFLAPNRGSAEHKSLVEDLGKLVLGLVLLDVIFTFAEYSIALYGAIPSDVAPLLKTMFGPFWYIFWIGQVGLGMIVPIILLSFKRSRSSALWAGLAGLSIVVAFVGVRLNIVIPPLTVPELKGLIEAVPGNPRLTTQYVPSMMEWFLTIGIIGLGLALFALGYSLLPIKPPAQKEA